VHPARGLGAKESNTKTKGNGKDHGGNHQKYDWGKFGDFLDHENLCSVALALIIGGLGKEATCNLLHAQVEAIDTPDLERKQRRPRPVPGGVASSSG
jgi:hypothetical protein